MKLYETSWATGSRETIWYRDRFNTAQFCNVAVRKRYLIRSGKPVRMCVSDEKTRDAYKGTFKPGHALESFNMGMRNAGFEAGETLWWWIEIEDFVKEG